MRASFGSPDGPDASFGGPGGPDVSVGGPDVSVGGPDGPDASSGGPDRPVPLGQALVTVKWFFFFLCCATLVQVVCAELRLCMNVQFSYLLA